MKIMANSFDWKSLLKVTYQECLGKGQDFKVFRDCDSDAERVTFCSRLPIWRADNVFTFIEKCCTGTRNGKCDEQSISWRQKGNAWFQKEEYNEALACYTQSIKIAPQCPPRSLNGNNENHISQRVQLALAIANRSAALHHLGHYELAVHECDLAIGCGYPSSSLYKVLHRKGQCLVKMGQLDQAMDALREASLALDGAVNLDAKRKDSLKSDMEKLIHSCSQPSTEGSPSIISKPMEVDELTESSRYLASASPSLSLSCFQDKGRFLVANTIVSAGELVIKEIPYAVVLLPDYHATHCHYCCRSTLNPIPCPDCADVHYCSDRCCQSAQDSHHWLECGLTNELYVIGTQALLSLRLLLHVKSWCHVQRVAREADTQGTSSTECENCLTTSASTVMNKEADGTSHSEHLRAEAHTSGLACAGGRKPEPHEVHAEMEEVIGSPHDCTSKHLHDTEPHTTSAISDVRDRTAPPDEAEASPSGCGRDGIYRNDYQAVYHLMTHTENHTEQELFNMTMTALLLSKCIQNKLEASPKWTHHGQGDSSKVPGATCTDSATSHPDQRNQSMPDSFHNNDTSRTASSKHYFAGGDHKCKCDRCGCLCDSSSLPVAEETAAVLLRHLQQLKCNSHAVTTIQTTSQDIHSSVKSISEMTNSRHQNTHVDTASGASRGTTQSATPMDTRVDKQGDKIVDAVVDTTKQVRLATAVYSTASLLNHACEPNVIASFHGAVLMIRATRDIQVGQELLHCYGPHSKHMSRDERQRALQEQYFFTCTCNACTVTPPDEMQTGDWSNCYGCSKCGHPLMPRLDKRTVGLCINPQCRNTQSLKALSKEKERAGNLFKLSRHFMECKHIEECLAILHQCYNVQREILYKHHQSLGETQDCLAKCYSLLGDFKQSGKYLRLSVATVEKQFGSDSIELANELHKLAQVLFNGGEVQDTLAITERAIKLLRLHYGPHHQDVEELTQMRLCLLSL